MAYFRMPRKRRYFLLIPFLAVACALIDGIYCLNAQVASDVAGNDDISASVRDFTGLYSTVEQNFADPLRADKAICDGAIPGMAADARPALSFPRPEGMAGYARRAARPLLRRRHAGVEQGVCDMKVELMPRGGTPSRSQSVR